MSDKDILEQALDDLIPHEQTFPGSTRKLAHRRPKARPSLVEEGYGHPGGRPVADVFDCPIVKTVKGEKREFFTTANVAMAVNRSVPCVRKWMQAGILPPAPFVLPNKTGDPAYNKRLWSRDHLEGLQRLAEANRISTRTRVPRTELLAFSVQLYELFESIKRKKR